MARRRSGSGRIRPENYPFAVRADHRTLVRDQDTNIRKGLRRNSRTESYALCIGDLKDPSLCKIEKEYLGIAVFVPRVLGCNVAGRFKYDEATVTADAARKRFRTGICELPDHGIDLRARTGTKRKYDEAESKKIMPKRHKTSSKLASGLYAIQRFVY